MILPASSLQDVFRRGGSSSRRSGVELRPVQPDAMQDDGELAGDGGLGPVGADLRAQLQPQVRSELSCRTLVISALAASNSRLRAGQSPALEIRPARSTSPDW